MTAPTGVAEALAMQRARSRQVDTTGLPMAVATVAGVDAAYEPRSELVVAAAVVLAVATLRPVAQATAVERVASPYVPGLLACREVPALLAALRKLPEAPHLLVCDGNGVAHPRRFGLACHVGVETGLPTIGVAKTPFVGRHAEPGPRRGDMADLVDGGEVVGRMVRTRDGVRPVYVSSATASTWTPPAAGCST